MIQKTNTQEDTQRRKHNVMQIDSLYETLKKGTQYYIA